MALRSPLARLAIAAATAALVTAAAVTPAVADDDWEGGADSGFSRQDDWSEGGDGGGVGSNQRDDLEGRDQHGSNHHDPRLYRGVVTANTLLLRSAPNRGSQVIRVAHRGDRVSIFCKTSGQSIQGNPLWYLLTDGTWAWGAARYIDNIGPSPRWC